MVLLGMEVGPAITAAIVLPLGLIELYANPVLVSVAFQEADKADLKGECRLTLKS